MGSVVKDKVGELEKITREGRSRKMMKKVVVCVHSMLGKNNLLFQFEYGQKEEMSSSLLVCFKIKIGG